MNITLIYINILTKYDANYQEPYPYAKGAERFKESYLKFAPDIPHRLVVVNSGTGNDRPNIFEGVADGFEQYHGRGWDCGTYQAVARRVKCDLMVCFNTLAYLWRPGWLEPMARAFAKYGKGVYGPTASLESFPHLRTPCIAFHPDVIARYPLKVDSRLTCCEFEHRKNNFSIWAQREGYPVKMVTQDGCYDQPEWRSPANIFRRGDQSNCLVFDRHTDMYRDAGPDQRRLFEQRADHIIR